MKKTLMLIALPVLTSTLIAGSALAHTGGPLDTDGCHADRRDGNYHCHLGPLRGRVFDSRAEMLKAVESGEIPAPEQKDSGSWWKSLNPFKSDSEEAAPAPPVAAAPAQAATQSGQAAGPPQAAPAERSFEDRLKILKGLREMDLITEEEYAARRREIIGEL